MAGRLFYAHISKTSHLRKAEYALAIHQALSIFLTVAFSLLMQTYRNEVLVLYWTILLYNFLSNVKLYVANVGIIT
jgi:hypothetical protein